MRHGDPPSQASGERSLNIFEVVAALQPGGGGNRSHSRRRGKRCWRKRLSSNRIE
ncbi:hypothetical protein IE4803_PD00508 (plasmid) [Rhizobium etli bv. phaseoli str. IE4803]|nr:hypothetical protein IE4803_PD00508 [Rhizobium etli bv. phaseoli str. IE4803]